MTTQGLTGFRYKEKDSLAYNHADSHPDTLGLNVYRELRDVEDWGTVRDRIEGLVTIPENRRLNEYTSMAESEVRRAFPNLKYDGGVQNMYDLYRPLQGTLKPYMDGKLMFMPDASDFIHNSGFCEWAYAMVPCTSLLDGKPKFFKTPHNGDLFMDKNVPVIDAALATSAAPVYFPAHYIPETNGIYVDGGLVGNAPGLFGYIEAITRLGATSPSDVEVLSIGTLAGRPCVSAKIANKLWWKFWSVPYGPKLHFWLNPIKPRLLEIVFSQNEQQVHNMLNLLLKDNYYIIDDIVSAEAESDIALDDPRLSARTLLLNRATQQAQEFTGSDFFKTKLTNQGT